MDASTHRAGEELSLESIERAIRNAFAKADAQNATTRQRIYESAWGAHERALNANTALSETQKTERRETLKETISRIERELSQPAATASARQEPRFEPSMSDDDIFGDFPVADRRDGASVTSTSDSSDFSADRGDRANGKSGRRTKSADGRQKKRSSPFFRYGMPALVLIAAGFIGLSLYNSFSDLSRGPTLATLSANGNAAPLKEGEEPGGASWITIFKPEEATRMSVHGRATAEVIADGANRYARVKSSGPEDTVTFDIGEGILNQVAGKTATFDVVARSSDGKPTQMTVNCDFAGLGDCGRRRYDVTDAQNDFLLDISFPDGKRAGGAGTITINSDLTGAGKAVDIYAIRVTTEK